MNKTVHSNLKRIAEELQSRFNYSEVDDLLLDIEEIEQALEPISNDEVEEAKTFIINTISSRASFTLNSEDELVFIKKGNNHLNTITSYISQLESKVEELESTPTSDEIEFANPLQFFYDVSRGNKFEYNDIKIFYNKEYETYSLNDERVFITPKTVSAIIKSCMKASDK